MLLATQKFISQKLNDVEKNKRYGVIIIQHLLDDTELFINLLSSKNFNILQIYGIEYSTKEEVVSRIKRNGFSANSPNIVNLKKELHSFLIKNIETFNNQFDGIIIHEVGGYFADIISQRESSIPTHNNITGIIEETKQGLWRYQKIDSLNTTVVSIADSILKDIEGKYIGEAAANVIIEDLNILDVSFEKIKIGIIGYGIIGNGVASAVTDTFDEIAVYDESPIALLKARTEGFKVNKKKTLLRTSDIIVGTSGNNSVSFDDLKILKDGVILCSASSRAIELPIDQIKKVGKLKKISNNINEFTMPWERRILIINEGFPINFRYNCLPISISDLMFCQLAYGIFKLLYQDTKKGINRLTIAEEKFISQLWLESWDEAVTN